MEYLELKGALVAKKMTYTMVSDKLGISRSTFIKKINGTTEFTLNEAIQLANLLKLNSSEKQKIFHF